MAKCAVALVLRENKGERARATLTLRSGKVRWGVRRGRAMGFEREELKRRLADGESLEVSTRGGSYEVWTEPYTDPRRCSMRGA